MLLMLAWLAATSQQPIVASHRGDRPRASGVQLYRSQQSPVTPVAGNGPRL
eukprot:SAG25_NODE_496_length_7401_cov_8.698439_13_plen_51_part_00